MSVHASSWAWIVDVGPGDGKCRPHVAKLVLVKLADNANDAGEAFPSIRRIATETALSQASVSRAIAYLEAAGLLAREARRGRGGRQASTLYRLAVTVPQTEGRSSSSVPQTEGPSVPQTEGAGSLNRQGEPSDLEAAPRSRRAVRARDPFHDRLAEVCYGTTELSRALGREVGVATAELKRQGVELDELEGLVDAYRRRMNGATLSASALAKWAPALRASTGSSSSSRLERARAFVELQGAELPAAALDEELARFRLPAGGLEELRRRGAELRGETEG